MNCPVCSQEIIKGRAVNSTIKAVDLVFKQDGAKFNLMDAVANDNRISARITAGEAVDAFYCAACRKIIMIADVD
ncbi:MAG: hypothetical protein IKM70_07315 [Firmicutes bacterium]|nr:hypothetical protein [Bacillota bacterium]